MHRYRENGRGEGAVRYGEKSCAQSAETGRSPHLTGITDSTADACTLSCELLPVELERDACTQKSMQREQIEAQVESERSKERDKHRASHTHH